MSQRRRTDSPTSSISASPLPPPTAGQQRTTSEAGIFSRANNVTVIGGNWTVAENVFGVPTNSPVPSPSRGASGSSHVSSSAGYEHVSRANTSVTSLESNELSESDSERYSRILMSKGHGFPLWIPQIPSDWPLEYRQGGVSIGDVGFVTPDGIFDTFFNVTLEADHPINTYNGVPEGFQPLRVGASSSNIRISEEYFGVGSCVTSKSVFRYPARPDHPTLIYEFGCPQYKEGAILTLPFGACREDIRNMKAWEDYAHRHSLSWYRFVNEVLGREVPNGSIYLVTGCDKTICWGNASFPKTHRPSPFEMTFGLIEEFRGQVSRFKGEWLNPGFAESRSGTSLELDVDDEPARNLCVFVRGFTASVRPGLWASLRGQVDIAHISAENAAENRQKGRFTPFSQGASWWSGFWGNGFGSGHGGQVRRNQGFDLQQQDVIIQSVPPRSQPINPSSIINLSLFEQTEEGVVAVTHDSVWCSAIQQTEGVNIWSPEFLAMLFATNKMERDQDAIFLTAEKSSTIDQEEQTYENSISDIRLGSASNESQDQRAPGFLQAVKVKNVSRKIDLQMAEEARKRPRCMQVLVLGQSDSGKGTLIKQCQRSIGPSAFQQEKVLWKLAIQLSAIRALRGTLELILQPGAAQTEAYDQPGPSGQPSADSLPGIAFSLFDPHSSESSGQIETYSAGFSLEDEDDDDFSSDAVTSIFSHSSARTSLTSFSIEEAQDQRSDLYVLQLAEELLVRELELVQAQMPQSLYGTISSGEINATQSKHLESNEAFTLEDILEDIRERMVPHLERSVTENDPVADVISNQLAAVANLLDPAYMPSDGEILHSKVPSRKTFEYQLQANGADGNPILWKFLSFRIPAKWSMIARDVDAIAFMLPVSTFNERSPDFPRLNRLEDTILGWRRLTSSRLITGIGLVLVLNKVDILEKKLKSGLRFSDFVVTYGQKPNEATTVCHYLKKHLKQIHKASSTAGPFFFHLGSLVESTSDVAIRLSDAVKTCVIRNNLQASHILV